MPSQPFDDIPQSPSDKSKKEQSRLFSGRQKAVNRVFIIAIYIIGGSFLIMFLVRIAHYIFPNLWLCEYHLSKIDDFVYTGVFGAVFGRQLSRLVEEK